LQVFFYGIPIGTSQIDDLTDGQSALFASQFEDLDGELRKSRNQDLFAFDPR
jgi:hypothetical protein